MFSEGSGVTSAEIIVIGNEVVSGLILDSNSRFLSERLQTAGVDVSRITAVGDAESAIVDAVQSALTRVGLVIVTGGLGATHDDITKMVLARLFDSDFREDRRVADYLDDLFKARGREAPPSVQSQWRVPQKAEVLYNEKGTAPGFLFKENGKKVFALPGVPLEMEHLFEKYIFPDLCDARKIIITHRILHTTGITEADLWAKVGSVEPLEKLVAVASLPSHLGVRIRLSALTENEAQAQSQLDEAESLLRAKAPDFIYGRDDETLEGNIGALLRNKKRTLAVAESCTGGLIGHRLTQISGSSEYFLEGAVTYGNEAKIRRLGVKKELLQKHGAVSREVALAMAAGIRETAGADLGLSVTGIAGPTGGTKQKPVGLTFIAVSDGKNSDCQKFIFHQDRMRNKERAAQAALNFLRLWLLNHE